MVSVETIVTRLDMTRLYRPTMTIFGSAIGHWFKRWLGTYNATNKCTCIKCITLGKVKYSKQIWPWNQRNHNLVGTYCRAVHFYSDQVNLNTDFAASSFHKIWRQDTLPLIAQCSCSRLQCASSQSFIILSFVVFFFSFKKKMLIDYDHRN